MYRIFTKIWLIMRLTTVLLIATLMQVSAAGLAQRITLKERNASLENVLKEIRRQSGYDIFFNGQLLDKAKDITVQVTNVNLEEALKASLNGLPLTYKLEGKTVTIIAKKEPSFLDRVASYFTDIDVHGVIRDEQGNPMPNATIQVKGKSQVYRSNEKGEFNIPNVADDAVLVISYVGYKTLEIFLKDAVMPLEIKLNQMTGELEEVKVTYNTGYQELNKERAAGSFTQIDNDLFNRRVGATILDRLDDLVPGMLKTGNSVNPLQNYTIRGIATINASTSPLLVVDNFIYEGDPNSLNPNDIESVTILKDATAASIWGVRAGNGVIVVTTKKGKANQKPTVSFISNTTLLERPNLYAIPSVPSKDVIALEKSRFDSGYFDFALNDTFSYPVLPLAVEIMAKAKNGEIATTEMNQQLDFLANYDIRDDINKYLLQKGIAQQYALNISGGTITHQYYGSIGYDKNRPNDVNIRRQKLSLRFNNTWRPLDKLLLIGEINWINSEEDNQNSLNSYSSLLNNPYTPLVDEYGSPVSIPYGYRLKYVDEVEFLGKLNWNYIPLDEARNGDIHNVTNNLLINGGANYRIIDGLQANLNYQWQKALSENTNIAGLETYNTRNLINRYVTFASNGLPVFPYPLGAIYTKSSGNQAAWNFRSQLNFNRRFGKHQVVALAGFEVREAKYDLLHIPVQYGYDENTNTFQSVQYGQWPIRPQGGTSLVVPATTMISGKLNRFSSILANSSYIYNEKYILSTSVRIDQSNFFGVKANDRKVPLWSIGGAWNISKETFYTSSWLPDLKLRATYGYNGNTNAGTTPMATIRYMPPISSNVVFVPFAEIVTSPNPQLKWEKVETINLALDFGFKQNWLTGSIEWYQKRGLDLISQITSAPSSGFETYTGNSSSIKGQGIDISVNSLNVRGKFQWHTAANLGYNEEKVTSYSVEMPAGTFSPFTASMFPIIGRPLNKLYSYEWAGLNPTTGDSQIYINGEITESSLNANSRLTDYIYGGRTTPAYFGALRNDFRWNNITLSININCEFGYYFRRLSFEGALGSFSGLYTWQHEDYLSAWRSPGDELTTNVPGFLDSYPDRRYNTYLNSDILIEKGDYIRLQDIRLSYDLNRSVMRKAPFKNISLYAYANNLGFLWKASKYNPDTQGGLSAPRQRSVALGLNIQF